MSMDVFVEVHDFGFGPACGFLDITEQFKDRYRWHVLAVGNAAAYIRKERPEVDIIPFNGFNKDSWPQLSQLVPENAHIVTFSHPGFAAYAAQKGYRVYLVDQLDWMWPNYPAGIEQVNLHLVQHYFGREATGKARASKAIEIRPIVTPLTFSGNEVSQNNVGTVIGLGGMAVAGNPYGGDSYAKWLLPHVVASLEHAPAAFPVRVVGGSPNLAEIVDSLGHSRVFAAGAVGRHSYMQMLQSSRFQILTPGLASIYEAVATGISPLFQPGVNRSMLLQLDSLIKAGYPFAVAWPWFAGLSERLKLLPAADAIDLITRCISSSVQGKDMSGELMGMAIEKYVSFHGSKQVPIALPKNLPEGGALLEEALQEGEFRAALARQGVFAERQTNSRSIIGR